jgi:DNA replication and repair protein RecF
MHVIQLTHVRHSGIRNLVAADWQLGPRFNVVSGQNGQGKTNLLEALYVLCTTRSFRTAKLTELTAHTAPEVSTIAGDFADDGLVRAQRVSFRAGQTLVRVNNKKPGSLAEYAKLSPAVVFHPGELLLSAGPSALRRKLLDRVSLFLQAQTLHFLERYGQAQRARQKTLQVRGPQSADLGAWEVLMAEYGTCIMHVREQASAALAEFAKRAFAQIAAPDLRLEVQHVTTAPAAKEAYLEALLQSRVLDTRRGSASIGPHRDDLELTINGNSARRTASQGQHRALVLALKSAEMSVIEQARGARPLLLLDDVSSELDTERTAAFFQFLAGETGQVILTTTRPDLITTGSAVRSDFEVQNGTLVKTG